MNIKSNSWMAKTIRAMALAVLSGVHSNAAEIKVLFIGGDSASEIPADLMGLVSGDNSIADTIAAEFYYENDVLDAYYEDRALPSDTNTFLNKLDEGFDFVFVMPKESYLFRYPGLALEEVRLVQKHLQGTGSSIAMPMIWGGGVYGTVDAMEYEDHSYRIGDALDIDILPAGLAWVNVLDAAPTVGASDPSSSLTSEASYLMAASAYAYIFEHSATNSTYTPSGVTIDERAAILGYSYSDWVGAATNSHYTGAYTGGFCSPLQIPFQATNTKFIAFGTSTEDGYRSKYSSIMSDKGYDAGGRLVSAYSYNLKYFPEVLVEPDVINFLANNHYDFAFGRWRGQSTSDYEDLRSLSANTDIPFMGFNYQGIGDNSAERILDTLATLSSDEGYGAYHSYSQNQIHPGTVFNVPALIAFSRLWDRSADLVEFSGVHVSDYCDAATASMMYTMLTDENCRSFDVSQSSGQTQEQYDYAKNLGYTIIKQLGSLERVAYDEANSIPAAVIGSDASAHSSPNAYGGGVFYFVDTDQDGFESCILHGTNSYDYEGSLTDYFWGDTPGNPVSTATYFTNTVAVNTTADFGLSVVDDLSQASGVSIATVRVLDSGYFMHDDLETDLLGGYGWIEPEWNKSYGLWVKWVEGVEYNGSYCMTLTKNVAASRSIDLSTATNNLTFEFAWKGKSLEAGETTVVEVYDGSWHTLKTMDSSMADNSWNVEYCALSPYLMVSNFQIRFTLNGDHLDDDIYIDALRIYEQNTPLSTDDTYEVLENTELTIAAPGVLLNDVALGSGSLTAHLLTGPANGTLVEFNPDGSFIYQPDADFIGTNSFTYEAVGSEGLTTSVATVTFLVDEPRGISGSIVFGNNDLSRDVDWKDYGFNDNSSTVNTAVITTNGITFSLIATTSANLNMNGAGDLWGVDGGNTSDRFDENEWVTFTCSVSGPPLSRLSLGSVWLNYFGASGERIEVSDGVTTLPEVSGGTVVALEYDGVLNGLTELTTTNVATWQLKVKALPGVGDTTQFGISSVSFDYTTEPDLPLATFESWAAENGVGAPLENDDLDSLNNLVEYAFNLDPLTADWQIVEPGDGLRGLPYIFFSGTGATARLEVEYLRRKQAMDLEYIVQISTNLVDWMNTSGTNSISSINSEWERVVQVDPVLVGDADSARFMRVQIENNPQNSPIAGDDTYEVLENTELTIAAPGVLLNDVALGSGSLTAHLLTGPSHGTLIGFLSDGSFNYQPDLDFTGTDSFTYEAIDSAGFTSSVATVTVLIPEVPASSGTITFGDTDLALDGFIDDGSTVNTAVITTNGISFSLTATTSASLNMNAAGTLWGISGGSNSLRLDDNGGAGGEWVTFTFSASGVPLSSLSLKHLQFAYFSQSYERIEVRDGTTTLPEVSGALVTLDYATALSGLTDLTASNTATWQLTVEALPGVGGVTDFAISELAFDYTTGQ